MTIITMMVMMMTTIITETAWVRIASSMRGFRPSDLKPRMLEAMRTQSFSEELFMSLRRRSERMGKCL
jgi:hypothetical protein